MYPSIMLRWPLATLLLAALTACSSTSIAPVPTSAVRPTSLPAATATTQPAPLPVTGGIDLSSLTGRIVFSAGPPHGEDIYVMNANGTDLVQVTTDPAAEFDPTLSPDGKQIAYRHQVGDDSQIYVINVDGSGATKLTNSDESLVNYAPAWSPDGTTIVWNSDRDNPQSGILHGFLMNTNGSDVRKITDEIYIEYPTWSPDGLQIAFMSPVPFGSSNYEIFVINVDGSGLTRLTDSPGPDELPAWSPDGKKLVFQSVRDDCSISNRPDCGRSGDIGPFTDSWVMNADGSGQRRLSHDSGEHPVWSPDGRYILYSAGDLYVMRADGSAVTRLPISGLGELTFPDWTL